ncbi:MAG: hypothetical protein JRH20_30725 [Deltaproteobacteria bacterium]|nr:hypothetical protein [Deltaproteobacteria bacterium]
MSYQEWWSLPAGETLSAVHLRRVVAARMAGAGIRVGVGYIPCEPEVIVPTVEEGHIDVFFCLAASRAWTVARALDADLASLLKGEFQVLEAAHRLEAAEAKAMGAADGAADEHLESRQLVLSVSLHSRKEGWEGPRMLLTDEANDNRKLWPLACVIGHMLARALGAQLMDPEDHWPVWDPDAVLTEAG